MKKLSEQLLQMKEEFDSVGIRLNGITWQRIQRHMEEYAKGVAKKALENAAENAKISPTKDWYSYTINKESITNESNIPELL